MFGSREYAHPLLRWLGVPLFRLGMLVLGLSIVIAGHSMTVTFIAVGALVFSVVVVELANIAVLRWRRHGSGSTETYLALARPRDPIAVAARKQGRRFCLRLRPSVATRTRAGTAADSRLR
jgi:hypothetical protein